MTSVVTFLSAVGLQRSLGRVATTICRLYRREKFGDMNKCGLSLTSASRSRALETVDEIGISG